MPPAPDSPADEAQRWLALAEGDLKSARILFEHDEAARRNVGFLAQQTAEKALKGLLAAHDLELPRSHDLVRLLDVLPDPRPAVTAPELAGLSPWAVQGRYDLDPLPLDHAMAARLLEVSTRLLADAARIVQSLAPHAAGEGDEPPATTGV